MGGNSCKKFLDEYSQDQVRPTNTIDLTAVMYSDAYPGQLAIDNFDLLTDDMQCNGAAKTSTGDFVAAYVTALQNGTAIFKFDPTMFDVTNTIPSEANVYTICYNKIKGCNVVMDYVSKVSGSDKEKNAILGQCLFLRAYYYLRLVTVYAQPYTRPNQDASTALGVPLILSSQVKDGGVARNTLKEVYDQVEKDLLSAATLLKDNYTPSSAFRVGATTAYALLSRLYLYRGAGADWDKVVEYSTLAIQANNNLVKLATFFNASGFIQNTGLYNIANAEILWVYGNTANTLGSYTPFLTTGYVPPYTVSSSLGMLYNQGTGTSNYGDLRYKIYFSVYNTSIPYYTAKQTANATYNAKGIRVAELYLNRAEALSRRFMVNGNAADRTQALADLNTLRESRYDTRNTAYANIAITDAAALYSFCQEERRRELCLEEGHRWIDIKRWGLSVTHTYTGTDGVPFTVTLPANSNLYALPLPYTAINNNADLQQNPR
jgi:hypothetical protein